MKQISERVQLPNDEFANPDGKYILYWMRVRQNALYDFRFDRQKI